MAFLKNRTTTSALIHHSDHGIQYCCQEYIKELEAHHIQISMSKKGNPYENAIAERVNGILKSEFYLDRIFTDIADVTRVVKNTIAIYNTERPHASCNYLTPVEAHGKSGILKKRWKNYPLKGKTNEITSIGEEVKKVLAQLVKKSEINDLAIV